MALRHLLAPLAAAALLVGACSESDADLSGADDATPADTDTTTDTAGDRAAEQRADAIELLVSQGISEDGATCIVDEVLAEGVDPADLRQLGGVVLPPELQESFAFASATCLDADDIADLPDEAFDLENPIIRRQFVESFSVTSGLSIEVSNCVVDQLIAAGFDARDAFGTVGGEIDEEALAVVSEAVESCV